MGGAYRLGGAHGPWAISTSDYLRELSWRANEHRNRVLELVAGEVTE